MNRHIYPYIRSTFINIIIDGVYVPEDAAFSSFVGNLANKLSP